MNEGKGEVGGVGDGGGGGLEDTGGLGVESLLFRYTE